MRSPIATLSTSTATATATGGDTISTGYRSTWNQQGEEAAGRPLALQWIDRMW